MKNLHFAELKNNIPCLAGAMQPGSFAAALFSAILLSLFIALAPRAAMCAPSRGALEPANEPAVLQHSGPGKFVLKYHGLNVLSGAFYRKDGTKPIPYNELDIEESKDKGMNDGPVTQKLTVSASSGEDIEFRGAIEASGEAFPAETRTALRRNPIPIRGAGAREGSAPRSSIPRWPAEAPARHPEHRPPGTSD